MEGALIGVSQAARLLMSLERNSARIFDRNADLLCRIEFGIEVRRVASDGWKEEAVNTAEIAGDVLLSLDLVDPVHGRRLARVIGLGGIAAPELDDGIERVVANRNQMGGGAGRHPLADWPAVDDDHIHATPAELISSG